MNKEIKERIKALSTIIDSASESLKNSPEGSLKVNSKENSISCFRIINGKQQYIKKSEKELPVKLAQKDYDIQILKKAVEQKRRLEKFLKNYNPNALTEIYEKLHIFRKQSIKPYELPMKERIKEWKSKVYKGKTFGNEQVYYLTRNNEHVRSKSEALIADTFDKYGIPYRYEYPLRLKEDGIIYPDFTVMNIANGKTFIFEHFGMIGNAEYEKNMNLKLKLYAKYGIYYGENFLYTMETNNTPLDTSYLEILIRHFLIK